MKNKTLLVLVLLLSSLAHGEEDALSNAIPDVSTLKTEECSASQNKLLGSVGLGKMACTISQSINFDSISKSLGVPAFQSGSRTNPLTPSDNVEDFVRYSPNFFTRIDQLYMKKTDRFIYSFLYKHLLDNSTRLFYLTGKNLRDNQRLQKLTLEQYKTAINDSSRITWKNATAQCKNTEARFNKQLGTKAAPYAKTFQQCGKSGTTVFFWYRRQLDGSGDALFNLLGNILKTQDAEFYRYANQ